MIRSVAAAILFAIVASPAWAEKGQEPAGHDASALARASQNPVADLISLPFQNNSTFDTGPTGGTLNVLNIQPVIPISLNDDWNLITRTIVPITSQPSLGGGTERQSGLGDATFTGFFSPTKPLGGKVIVGLGPVVLFPTATDDRLGSNKWGLGPALVVLTTPGNWVIGSLLSQVWSIAGSGDETVSLFTWQPFVNYNLDHGWYLSSSPIITANWEAGRGGDTWTVPIGGGFGRVFRLGKLPPMNASAQAFYNVARPQSLGRWSLRLQLQLLFPKG